MTSAFVLVTTLFVVLATILAWPFRAVWRMATLPPRPEASIKRLIVVGLDGQDPTLTDQFMQEGLLPNFSALAAEGSYRRLATTYPSLSPVAWSSFSTGTNPARHNIFDFLNRDRRTYLPMLSSTYIGKVDRFLRLGKYRIPLGSRNCGCCAGRSRSGRSLASTASGAPSSACRSPSRPTASMAPS